MRVRTTDGKILELDELYALKSYLLSSLATIQSVEEPIDILVDSKTMRIIYDFMIRDNHALKREYNSLEIHFSNETLSYFDSKSTSEVISICNGANYLEYPYLLEVCCKILAIRLSQGSAKTKNEVLGERRITEEDMSLIIQDFDWANESI
ncbi:uncharacterized protein VICG_01165 [Vittaforma corneae ATCC 50505]|uniref:SKP1 component POZ domain-containing protein n=1 Tax=Vittaforma corneae (strain ATCC 50505) TaxID=993615 RepID=L2GLP7_VITCO|nr:uncharacterized protein VICG_01165 [Vittaforma corneae ATCC 50505]ELA41813.1 hypothetical protein VICG_01165 [Vittaforma corneae ATCC 50505]